MIRCSNQAACDWVAMDVPELLDALLFRVDVEIVVSRLPEGPLLSLDRDREFKGLQCLCENGVGGFADEQVYVLRHDDVPSHEEVIAQSHGLKRGLEKCTRIWRSEVRSSVVTTEGDEVEIAGLLVADQVGRHPDMVQPHVSKTRHGAPSFC